MTYLTWDGPSKDKFPTCKEEDFPLGNKFKYPIMKHHSCIKMTLKIERPDVMSSLRLGIHSDFCLSVVDTTSFSKFLEDGEIKNWTLMAPYSTQK